jgi:transcriptional regulator with XRE-family HTH domain
MKPKDFKRWRKSLGLSQKDAAEALGLKRRVVQYYEKGERDGKDVGIPKAVRLACYALTEGVSDYHGPREAADRADSAMRPATNGAVAHDDEHAEKLTELHANGDGKKPGKHAKDNKDRDGKDRDGKGEKKNKGKDRENALAREEH